MKIYKHVMILSFSAVLAACDQKPDPVVMQSPAQSVSRNFDFAQLSRGEQLFRQNCAMCHGDEAQGAKNWQQAGPDGKYPPPPLNGTAHTWHHSKKVLVDVIQNGTQRLGGNMPAWKDKLSEEEIDAIINWFQSKWSDQVYTVWHNKVNVTGK